MLIGEFAAELGTSARMLRHYEDTGLLAPAGRDGNGYRVYAAEQLPRTRQIKGLIDARGADRAGRPTDRRAHRQRWDLSRARRSGHGRGGRVRVAADVPLRRLHGRAAGRAGCVPGCAERRVRSGVIGPHPLRWVRARGPADRAR
ncbi:MerR family transcriptional regulator [Enemella evansiae]|nr:MerR family transcriptional regulator [Enemella evansiae]